jgi:glycosyltransferase involved in cell wall biosynthesis
MCSNKAKGKNVAVIYTYYPHYRTPVFRKMAQSDEFNYKFYYDPNGVDPTIISGTPEKNHFTMRTWRWGKFEFQPGALLIALRPDVDIYIFHGSPFVPTTWIAALLARTRGRTVLFWTHGWLRHDTGAKAVIRKTFYRIADGLLVYANRAKTIGSELGYPKNRIHVISNSLDYAKQRSIRLNRSGQSMKQKKPYFLTVSRLVPFIELNIALDAVKNLQEMTDEPFDYIIVGDGPLRASLEATASSLGVNAQFLGAIYDEEALADLFIGCTAVVSPGKIGLLAMHAMAYGSMVITHDDLDRQMPEVEAVTDGITGAFFKYGDSHDLAKKMKSFLDHEPTTAQREAAIMTIEKDYTPDQQVVLIEKALHTVR